MFNIDDTEKYISYGLVKQISPKDYDENDVDSYVYVKTEFSTKFNEQSGEHQKIKKTTKSYYKKVEDFDNRLADMLEIERKKVQLEVLKSIDGNIRKIWTLLITLIGIGVAVFVISLIVILTKLSGI